MNAFEQGQNETDLEIFLELMNIGFGPAVAQIGRRFHRFVKLGTPSIVEVSVDDLPMAFANAVPGTYEWVHQGFGPTFPGKAVVALGGGANLATLLGVDDSEHVDNEVLVDVANTLVSATVETLSDLLRSEVSFAQPCLHRTSGPINDHRADRYCHAILISARFQVEDVVVRGGLALVIPDSGRVLLCQAIQEFAEAL